MSKPIATNVRELLPLLLEFPQYADCRLTRYMRICEAVLPKQMDSTGAVVEQDILAPFGWEAGKDLLSILMPVPIAKPQGPTFGERLHPFLAQNSDPIAVLKDSPWFLSPFTVLTLIPCLAEKLATQSGGSADIERAEILRNLGLHNLLRFSDSGFGEVCKGIGTEPNFEGVCALRRGKQLAQVVAAGFGLKDLYGYLASTPDPYVAALTFQEPTRATVGDTAIMFYYFTEPTSSAP